MSSLQALSSEISKPGFEVALQDRFTYVHNAAQELRLPPEVADFPSHLRNDWGRAGQRVRGLQGFLAEMGKHTPDTPPPPAEYKRLEQLCLENRVDRIDALQPILKEAEEATVDWRAFYTTATEAATELLSRFQQRHRLTTTQWIDYLAKLRDALAQRLSGAVRPEPLQGLDKAVATLKQPEARNEEQVAEVLERLEELDLLPPPRDLQHMMREDWATFQAKAMQPAQQELERLAELRSGLLGPDLIEATKALRALSPEERQAAMTPPIDLAARDEAEKAFEEKWEVR